MDPSGQGPSLFFSHRWRLPSVYGPEPHGSPRLCPAWDWLRRIIPPWIQVLQRIRCCFLWWVVGHVTYLGSSQVCPQTPRGLTAICHNAEGYGAAAAQTFLKLFCLRNALTSCSEWWAVFAEGSLWHHMSTFQLLTNSSFRSLRWLSPLL